MGLYQDLQDDLHEALNTDLNDAYATIQITSFTIGDYNTVTGTQTDIENTKNCQCVILTDKEGSNNNDPSNIYDLEILVLDSDKPFDLETEQKIYYSGSFYRIIVVDTDPVKASWTLQCMFWK